MSIKNKSGLYILGFSSICLIVMNLYTSNFRLGLENIPDTFIEKIKNARIALVTNQTGKDQQGNRNVDLLLKKGLKITAILATEHGFYANIPCENEVPNSIDSKTGIPIVILYQKWMARKITEEMLKDYDIIMFDIQDAGIRYFTYISTLFDTLEAAAQFNKQYIVLDRPNPLGQLMEGPLVDETNKSFISRISIPLRHGMTIGELAWFFNKHILKKPANLHVIRMKEYKRTGGLEKMKFTHLSPSVTSLSACYGYTFLGLLGEIRPFDTGRYIDKPFQTLMLPEKITLSDKKWEELQGIFKQHGINSSPYKTYIPLKKGNFKGLRINIDDINNVYSFRAFLDILNFFKKAGVELTFSKAFGKAVGINNIQTYMLGKTDRKKLTNQINTGLNEFFSKAQSSFLYEPAPKPVMLN